MQARLIDTIALFSLREKTMDSTRQNPQFRQSSPPGAIARLVAFVLSAALLVLGFMFSLVALAVVAVLGVVLSSSAAAVEDGQDVAQGRGAGLGGR